MDIDKDAQLKIQVNYMHQVDILKVFILLITGIYMYLLIQIFLFRFTQIFEYYEAAK